jgi:cytosine/adenosine deaminase-related metal-dependent hydrolase
MQRARLESAGALPPRELLRLATIDGARALGMDARIGTLATGKDADMCAVRISAPHTWPVNDPVATLFLAARGSDVVLTTVRGAVLFRAGDHNTLADIDALRAQLDDAAARMRAARDRA